MYDYLVTNITIVFFVTRVATLPVAARVDYLTLVASVTINCVVEKVIRNPRLLCLTRIRQACFTWEHLSCFVRTLQQLMI